MRFIKDEKSPNTFRDLQPGATDNEADGALIGDQVVKMNDGTDIMVTTDPATGNLLMNHNSLLSASIDRMINSAKDLAPWLFSNTDHSGIYDGWRFIYRDKHLDWAYMCVAK